MTNMTLTRITPKSFALTFPYDPEAVKVVKSCTGALWDPAEKRWILPDNDITKKWIEENNKFILKEGKNLLFFDMHKEMKIRKYSLQTQNSYIKHNEQLVKYSNKSPADININDVKAYLYFLANGKSNSAATINLAINAIKFYYNEILKRDFILELTRPKRDKILPVVLSQTEIQKIIAQISNFKHKTIVMLIYSSGLRVSEAARIKKSDIDIDRKMVCIKGGKGRKDRISLLSDYFIEIFNLYIKTYSPEVWLFSGQQKGSHISIRTLQKIFEDAKNRAKITKNVGIHGLRHSFATHLLENGTDIRSIQTLLGHASPKTTMIYTHVTNKYISKIVSPLDMINFNNKDAK